MGFLLCYETFVHPPQHFCISMHINAFAIHSNLPFIPTTSTSSFVPLPPPSYHHHTLSVSPPPPLAALSHWSVSLGVTSPFIPPLWKHTHKCMSFIVTHSRTPCILHLASALMHCERWISRSRASHPSCSSSLVVSVQMPGAVAGWNPSTSLTTASLSWLQGSSTETRRKTKVSC